MESAHCDKKLNVATAFIAVRTASFRPDDVTMGLTFAPVTSDKDNKDGEEEEEEEDDLLRTIIKNDTAPMQKHLQMEASIQLPSEVFEGNTTKCSCSLVFNSILKYKCKLFT